MYAKRILLVEDNMNDIELTLAALEEHRLSNQVDVVRDGVEAIDYLYKRGAYSDCSHSLPMVMLLDLKMPRMDGLEVLRRVKRDDELKTIPIVMLTSSREEQDVVESYKLGVNAYVVKPVAFDNFVAVVKQLGLFWVLINEPPPDVPPKH
ncbi:MAG TPA: response regulator [Blastocatellia bacterium]|nr:response regulator [Blastocatellia bacterium]